MKSAETASLKPVPVKNEKKLPAPAVSAALGMAASYYSYPVLISAQFGKIYILALLFILAAIIAFLRVAVNFPGKKNRTIKKVAILAVALAAGFTLGITGRVNTQGPVRTGAEPESVIAVSGILREDPRSLQGGSGMGILELAYCTVRGGTRLSSQGNLTVFFPQESIPRLKEFGRGCEIYADGRLSEGSRGLMFNATSVHIVKPAPPLEAFRTGLRVFLLEKFQSRQGREPPVWGSLASALLLGVRDDLDVDLSEAFMNSGCAHILALSGMHLAILSGVLAFLIRRPLGILVSSLVGAVFIIAYVFIAGSQPSLVRSAIMYLIGTIALWGLLKRSPLSLLCLAFIIQIIFQSDTGISLSFILSYLALLGILTMGESIRALCRGRLPEIVSVSLSASIGAFVVTAPVVCFYFGALRPIGIVAGLLVAPISSVFMVLAMAALAASFLPVPLWNVLDFFLILVYRLLEFLVSMAGKVPGFPVSNPVPVLIFTLLFWILVIFLQKRDNLHRNSVASFD